MRATLVLALLVVPVLSGAQAGRTTQRGSIDELPVAFVRRSTVKGTGKFLTAKEIESARPANTPELLAHVSGGEVQTIAGVPAIVRNRRSRQNMIGGGPAQPCAVGIALNANPIAPGYDIGAIRVDEIAAIEFYDNPSSIPLELGGNSSTESACGLFVIWHKDRKRPR